MTWLQVSNSCLLTCFCFILCTKQFTSTKFKCSLARTLHIISRPYINLSNPSRCFCKIQGFVGGSKRGWGQFEMFGSGTSPSHRNSRRYFFLCGYLKSPICEATVETEEYLISRILAACGTIQNMQGTFEMGRHKMVRCCKSCSDVNDLHFEKFL